MLHNLITPGYPTTKLSSYPYRMEAKNFFARINTPLSAKNKDDYNTLTNSLLQSGAWDRLVCLWLYAAPTSAAGLLNLKGTSNACTLVNAPTFTAYRGFAGDGATSYVRTNYTPASPIAQDNMSFGLWINTNTAADVIDMGQGTLASIYARRVSGNLRSRISTSSTTDHAAIGSSAGMTLLSRNNSANYQAFKDATKLSDVSQASTGLAGEMYVGARNNGGTGGDYSSRQIAAAFVGQSLSDAQALALYNALNVYMTSVGAA